MKMRMCVAILLLWLTGCGSPFGLECDGSLDKTVAGVARGFSIVGSEVPAGCRPTPPPAPQPASIGSLSVHPPLPPRSIRPGPDAGKDAGAESDASDLDSGDPDAGIDDGAAPFAPDERPEEIAEARPIP